MVTVDIEDTDYLFMLQEEGEMECDTLLPQSLPNGHAPVYPYVNGYVHPLSSSLCCKGLGLIGLYVCQLLEDGL